MVVKKKRTTLLPFENEVTGISGVPSPVKYLQKTLGENFIDTSHVIFAFY